MNENTKTLTFVILAVVVSVGAWLTRPESVSNQLEEEIGQPFYPDFVDPLAAASLEITDYNEAVGAPRTFKLAQVDNRWVLPSHSNYPADAKDQLAAAAASVFGLKRDSLVGNSAALHEEFGVINPDPKKLTAGAKGVGRRVTLKDQKGQLLADFIIGAAVEGQQGLHYVRNPSEDAVYSVAVDVSKLSTKFDDWIEKDLLKLNALDIKQVAINDSTVDEASRALIQRGKILLSNTDNQWNLESMEVVDPEARDWRTITLKEGEELNTQKLNEMKTALDDLKIVNVFPKPKGLRADLMLRAADLNNVEMMSSLATRGFMPTQLSKDGTAQLASNEGEVTVGLADGVEYILRFGELDTRATTADDAAKDGEGADAVGINRYIMVTARFNQDLIPLPDLQAVPGEEAPSDDAAADEPAADEAATDEPADEATPQETPATDEPASDEPAGEEPAGEEPAGEEPAAEEPAADEQVQRSQSLQGELLAFADEEPADGEPAEGEAVDEAVANESDAAEEAAPEETGADEAVAAPAVKEPADADAPPARPATTERPKTEAELAKERKAILNHNKLAQKNYDERVTKGQEKVDTLNASFGKWYYVISDEVYQKIHLSSAQIIQEKPIAPGEGQGVQDFDALQDQLNRPAPPAGGPPLR